MSGKLPAVGQIAALQLVLVMLGLCFKILHFDSESSSKRKNQSGSWRASCEGQSKAEAKDKKCCREEKE